LRFLGILSLSLVGLLLLGLSYQAIASAVDASHYPPPGKLVDIGGYRLHINCTGTGSPTVILDAGLGGTSLDWSKVQPAVAHFTRVCSYDRAGYGWSDTGPGPRTSQQIVKELHLLLVHAQVSGPYILVGHSLGGLNMRQYAYRYPGEVAEMVLLNATSSFNSRTNQGQQGISHRSCKPMYHNDGENESKGVSYADPTIFST